MNLKNLLFILLGNGIFFFLLGIFFIPSDKGKQDMFHDECLTPIDYTIVGESMKPLIEPGDIYRVAEGYYTCNNVERGDVIIYRSVTTSGDIIKQIYALPGDTILFKNQEMYINETLLVNSVGEKYVFSSIEQSILQSYLSGGILAHDTFFAFGDNTKLSIDSRKMGGLGKENFIGKVLYKK